MRSRGRSMVRMAMPLKAAVQRFAFLILVGAASALLVLGKADVYMVERFRMAVDDMALPLLATFQQPVEAFHTAMTDLRQLWWLRTDNQRLREENARLLAYVAETRHLAGENARLKALLHVVPNPAESFVSARVVADTGGPFVRTMLLDAGSRDGIRMGQAVVGEGRAGQMMLPAVVGRVVEVGRRTSRVLLLTDLNSRIPVVLAKTRQRAVAAGDNSALLRLDYLPLGTRATVGERVLTSGTGGLLPPGLPIGIVVSAGRGQARVAPFIDRNRIELVSVIRYFLPPPEAEPSTLVPAMP